jgi:hypothetical protein
VSSPPSDPVLDHPEVSPVAPRSEPPNGTSRRRAGPRSEDRSCDRCGAATVVHHPTRSAFDNRHRVPTRCASCQVLAELERTFREEAWRWGHLDPHPDPWDPWDDEDPTGWEPRPLDR